MPVPFGIFVPQGWRLDLVDIPDLIEQYETMTRVGQVAEAAGFDSIWLYDHFHTVPTIEHETTFECWMSTAGLARDTSRIKIGQMVTCNGYRQPSLLAKMASTVDVMSHGRLIFGLGAGWYEHEWRAFGYGFPQLLAPVGGFPGGVASLAARVTSTTPMRGASAQASEPPRNTPPASP